jgi:mannose-1-phosphate guanylyltransferase/mannose-6-phosphate isomerase
MDWVECTRLSGWGIDLRVMAEFHDVDAFILAGGAGTRLWPLSRLQSPKQFLQLAGPESLLESTIGRLRPLLPDTRITVVTSSGSTKGPAYELLRKHPLLLEPASRNTAPAIALAALSLRLARRDPVMLVLPSDHVIQDVAGFQKSLQDAVNAARDGGLVTFGIPPTFPATGFGYIKCEPGSASVRRVLRFKEKPAHETAVRFLAEGNHFWNSGMFVWKASAILGEIERAMPALASVVEGIARGVATGETFEEATAKRFGAAPPVSIDYGVLEHAERVFMVPGDFGWSDVGTWDAVYEVSAKDSAGNSATGNVLAIDCEDSLVKGGDRLVAVLGLKDVRVIDTPDALLVTTRGQSEKVRQILDELERRAGREHIEHVRVERPWGTYTVMGEGPGFKIKKIEVKPGGRLSLQSHQFRSEHWVVTSGLATVTRDGERYQVRVNESTFVPAGTRHRLENLQAEALQLIEVQVGSSVDESDIQRFDDVYGRTDA